MRCKDCSEARGYAPRQCTVSAAASVPRPGAVRRHAAAAGPARPPGPSGCNLYSMTKNVDAIIIAHNASFDRKFAERSWPVFERKAWGCSATEVEWRRYGFEGSRLGYLLNGAGLFHQAHRAVDDYHALLEILAFELPIVSKSALGVLLERARKKMMRVWAEQSPFDLKDSLKRRGYRWSDGSDGRPRLWYVDVDESKLEDEIAFLKTEIYLRDVEPRLQALTAFNRFSVRA